jgi:putative ABC transport system permease protein
VLRFALGASFATALLFGLLPALQLTRPGRAQDPLREAQRGSTQRSSLRGALVVSETALALVLLFGAALLSRSFVSASAVAPGFRTEGVLKLRLSLPEPRYPESSRSRFFENLLERARALPGVASDGAVSFLPLEGDDWRNGIEIEGRPDVPDDRPTRAHVRFATTGYFETMGVPLLDGRLLEPYDSADGAAVVVINETMAERYWPGE